MRRARSIPPVAWRDPRHRLGLDGEAVAASYLEAMGWSVLAHRFRVGRNDLDLIVRRGSLVAFVEVKTRRGAGHGQGREAIGWRKRRTLARLAEVWRLRHGRPDDSYRFDVIEVVHAVQGDTRIAHLEDAWRLPV